MGQTRALLVTSNSPFPSVFFTLFKHFLTFSSNSELLPAKSFSFDESKICHLEKDLNQFKYPSNTSISFFLRIANVSNLDKLNSLPNNIILDVTQLKAF